MSTVTVAQFRADFPEFADANRYLDSRIQMWLTVADNMLSLDRWGALLPTGIELFTAHQISMSAVAADDAKRGLSPGQSSGILSSESVDKVSASYDTSSATYKDAGFWNLTVYGTQYWSMVQMFGAGPVLIGAGDVNLSPASGGSWAGPYGL